MGKRKILPFLLLIVVCAIEADYRIGVSRSDVTGPAAEIVFMGFAKATQKGRGIHLRQFARCFILDDGTSRLAFVSVDIGMIGNGIRNAVLKRLRFNFGDLYTEENLVISGTHTHGAPGGFLMDVLYDISCFGFIPETFHAAVDGIVEAIVAAHEHMVDGKVYITSGELLDANINRSPAAYLLNPESERAEYEYNVDKEMIQLQFKSNSGEPLAVFNWFAVHPVSMNNSNRLITSDNVGYASILFEGHIDDALPGTSSFVAAFASANLGDVSPNLDGPRCINTGEPCDEVSSTCDGLAHNCIASGPGENIYESTKIIAERLVAKAKSLWLDSPAREVTGSLGAIHQFINVSAQEIDYEFPNGTVRKVHGCLSAMGYSFAAGTTDGPGEFDFKQGTTSGNLFWNLVANSLAPPTKEDVACHHPKPILLMTGRMKFPTEWQPTVVSTQMFKIGDVFLAAVPGEFSTMSGRRLRKKILQTIARNQGQENAEIIIAGLSNTYSSYIATPEEYQLQRYEGASTIYGPYTLPIYLEQYGFLTEALIKNEPVDFGPVPEDLSDEVFGLVLPVVLDTTPFNTRFGQCILQPPLAVNRGETVKTKFISGHPRNDVMHGKTFLAVERKVDGGWVVVANDANWETKFVWKRTSIFGTSAVTITWTVSDDTEPGTYRVRHYGFAKHLFGRVKPYSGVTRNFRVI